MTYRESRRIGKRIAGLHKAGSSYEVIATLLNKEGVLTMKGNEWDSKKCYVHAWKYGKSVLNSRDKDGQTLKRVNNSDADAAVALIMNANLSERAKVAAIKAIYSNE